MNCVMIAGVVTRCELKNLSSGQAMLPISVKVEEKYVDKNGETKDSSATLDVVFFGDKAKMLSNLVIPGAVVSVTGKLKKRKVEEKYLMEISPEHLVVLFDPRGAVQPQPQPQPQQYAPPPQQQYQQPQQNYQQPQQNYQQPQQNYQQPQQYAPPPQQGQYMNGQAPYHPHPQQGQMPQQRPVVPMDSDDLPF